MNPADLDALLAKSARVYTYLGQDCFRTDTAFPPDVVELFTHDIPGLVLHVRRLTAELDLAEQYAASILRKEHHA